MNGVQADLAIVNGFRADLAMSEQNLGALQNSWTEAADGYADLSITSRNCTPGKMAQVEPSLCQVSALADEETEAQINMLIYSMGDQAEDILHSFGLSAEVQKKYDIVFCKFNEQFIPKRNTIFERAN